MKTLRGRFEEKYIPVTESGCWLWTGPYYPNGYGRITSKGKEILAHRLSYKLYKGQIEEGKVVMHTCDVRCCVNPDHLKVGTQKENLHDMYDKGRRIQTGEHNHRAKLTEKEVKEIRTKYRKGVITYKQLGEEYNVTGDLIGYIINHKIWKDIIKCGHIVS